MCPRAVLCHPPRGLGLTYRVRSFLGTGLQRLHTPAFLWNPRAEEGTQTMRVDASRTCTDGVTARPPRGHSTATTRPQPSSVPPAASSSHGEQEWLGAGSDFTPPQTHDPEVGLEGSRKVVLVVLEGHASSPYTPQPIPLLPPPVAAGGQGQGTQDTRCTGARLGVQERPGHTHGQHATGQETRETQKLIARCQ